MTKYCKTYLSDEVSWPPVVDFEFSVLMHLFSEKSRQRISNIL